MTDTKFYKVMGVFQILIGFINFYVAFGAMNNLAIINVAVAALCTTAGVFCTVIGAKIMGVLE